MSRSPHLFALVSLCAVIVGCGDTPHVQLRDTISVWNEFADVVYTIPEDIDTAEAYAEQLLKNGALEQLKKKWEALKKRLEGLNKLDRDGKPKLEAAIEELANEARFAIGRVEGAVGANNAAGKRVSYGLLGDRRKNLAEVLAKRARAEGYEAKVGTKKDLAGWVSRMQAEGKKTKVIDPEVEFPKITEVLNLLETFQPADLPRESKNASRYAAHWNYNRYKTPTVNLELWKPKDTGGDPGGQPPGGQPPGGMPPGGKPPGGP